MRCVLYVDMDAFYLSCERTRHPEIEGKPAIVAHDPKEGRGRGVVLSASYPARALGFRSAMPVKQAWQQRDLVTWLLPDFEFYQALSDRVMVHLREVSPTTRVFSIDEAALQAEVAGPEAATQAAKEIQAEIRRRFDLPSSVGVAPTLTLAKMASDKAKPGGVHVVFPEHLREFLAGLPLRKVPGIGPVSERALEASGARTFDDVSRIPRPLLRKAVGSLGNTLREWSEGRIPEEPWPDDLPSKSMGQMVTFDEDQSEEPPIQDELQHLCDGLEESLGRSGMKFRSVTVQVRWEDLGTSQRSQTVRWPTESASELRKLAKSLLRQLLESPERGERKVRTLGVSVHGLRSADPGQQRLPI